MATSKASLSHLERTAEEPRDDSLHTVRITAIESVNLTIRLFQLTPTNHPIKFLPGQWLDVYCPSIPKAGGFTITSPPSSPNLELAIQKSPANPPAAWLWQPEETISGKELRVRVGGSFVWPPKRGIEGLKRVVFVAGGVGINPLMSMMSSISGLAEERGGREGKLGFQVKFLYSVKTTSNNIDEILFLPKLARIFEEFHIGRQGRLGVFCSNGEHGGDARMSALKYFIGVTMGRITEGDLVEALGPVEERGDTVCYICGPPAMTDEFVEKARIAEGMLKENVLFEKWW